MAAFDDVHAFTVTRPQELRRETHVAKGRGQTDSRQASPEGELDAMQKRLKLLAADIPHEGV